MYFPGNEFCNAYLTIILCQVPTTFIQATNISWLPTNDRKLNRNHEWLNIDPSIIDESLGFTFPGFPPTNTHSILDLNVDK